MGEETDAAVQREQLIGDGTTGLVGGGVPAGTGGDPNPTLADGGAGGWSITYLSGEGAPVMAADGTMYRTVNGVRVPISGVGGGGRPDGGAVWTYAGLAGGGGNGGGGRGGAVAGAVGGNGGVGAGWSSSSPTSGYISRLIEDAKLARKLPYVVSDSHGAPPGGHVPILAAFATEQLAARFIGLLPDHETGRYNLDGPADDQ